MDNKVILKALSDYLEYDFERLKKLKDYYLGNHKVLEKKDRKGRTDDPKIVANAAKKITTIATGYFLGIPIKYKVKEEFKTQLEKIEDFLTTEEEQKRNYQIAVYCSVFGKGYELAYLNDNKELKFKALEPLGVFSIKDETVEENIIAVCRVKSYTKQDKTVYRLEVYTESEILNFETNELKKDSKLVSLPEFNKPHGFNRIPIFEYKADEYMQGDFEGVISIIDAYNDTMSGNVAEIKDVSNALLNIINGGGTEDEKIVDIMNAGFIRTMDGGGVEWITKNINDTFNENIKKSLKEDIHSYSLVPDLTDSNFSNNASGISIKYKTMGLEQLTAKKEMYFKETLNERLSLLIEHFKAAIEPINIEKVFTRNLPNNVTEEADNAQKLTGIASKETILGTLSIVEDTTEELNKIATENDTGL